MNMNKSDIEIIRNAASFLENYKFDIMMGDNAIVYTNEKISFIIAYERYDDVSMIDIKFNEKNEAFDIGWIAFVRNHLKSDAHKPLQNILELLEYVKLNFDKITEYSYCKESQKMIETFILDAQK